MTGPTGDTGGWRIAAALLGLVLAGACAGTPEPQVPPPVIGAPSPNLGDRAADILGRAIRIITVNPPGDEEPLAELYVELLRDAGIKAEVIPAVSGDPTSGRASAWGRLKGSGNGRPIVLLSHLDVVPAEGEGWSGDPFDGRRKNGFVFGRGAIDAKGVSVVHLLTLIELAKNRVKLSRDVIFLATPDEETGGVLGAGALTRENADLLRDAAYLLTEGGGVQVTGKKEPAMWGVTVTEKSPCWLRVVASGTPGHSSVPPLDAAVPRLIAALDRIQRTEMPVRVVPPVAAMFAALVPLAAESDRVQYANLARALEADLAFRGRFLENRHFAALVRDSLTTTVLEGSWGTNILPPTAAAHIDARLLPGNSCPAFADRIRNVIADPGVGVEILLSFPSGISSADSPLFRAIERVAEASDPGAVVVPSVIAGFTDAHYFRALGITAYGFVPRWHRPDELRGVHGPNERISVRNLKRGVVTMIAILKQLDLAEAEEAR